MPRRRGVSRSVAYRGDDGPVLHRQLRARASSDANGSPSAASAARSASRGSVPVPMSGSSASIATASQRPSCSVRVTSTWKARSGWRRRSAVTFGLSSVTGRRPRVGPSRVGRLTRQACHPVDSPAALLGTTVLSAGRRTAIEDGEVDEVDAFLWKAGPWRRGLARGPFGELRRSTAIVPISARSSANMEMIAVLVIVVAVMAAVAVELYLGGRHQTGTPFAARCSSRCKAGSPSCAALPGDGRAEPARGTQECLSPVRARTGHGCRTRKQGLVPGSLPPRRAVAASGSLSPGSRSWRSACPLGE